MRGPSTATAWPVRPCGAHAPLAAPATSGSRLAESEAGDAIASPPVRPACQISNGAMTRLTMAITLMRMFIEGPDVSLKGSPTVSPTTVA